MPQNIFGTDGVRGVANADLSCDLAFRLGRAATKFLGPDICIGRDTRLSGTMLESALTAGIMAEGGRPHCCGVIPTPAVALLTVQNELDGGIVISASHNPPEFNGIKFFSRKGMKLPDAVEEEISAWVMSEEAMAADTLPTGAGVGHIIKMKDARKAYVDHAIDTLDGLRLDGLVVAVDCGHGASCQTTPAALQRLGATVHAINTDYCGTDINVECGSTHLEPLRELVLRTHADIGLAHDGDADRVLFVDGEGNEIDGDYILAICGSDLAARGKLAEETFSASAREIGRRLELADQMRLLLDMEHDFPGGEYPDVDHVVAKLRVEGTFLDVGEVVTLHRALSLVGSVVAFILAREGQYPALYARSRGVEAFPGIVQRIDAIVDRFGNIRDNASPALLEIRRAIREREGQAAKRLQAVLAAAKGAGIVDADAQISIREGKAVIPVAAANKRKLQGFIHDESATGRTFYVEPVEVVEINNELRELEYAERREVVRILTE